MIQYTKSIQLFISNYINKTLPLNNLPLSAATFQIQDLYYCKETVET